jgi:hypothetical protein
MDDFEDGVLPRVCASSGAPGDRLYHSNIDYAPAWPFLFLLLFPFGILIAIVLRFTLTRRAEGFLPYADHIQRHMRVSRRHGWIATGIGAGVIAGGGAGLMGRAIQPVFTAMLVVGILVVVGGLIRACYPAGSIGGKPDANGRWIELAPVSNEFADAYEAQERQRRAERRAEVTRRD